MNKEIKKIIDSLNQSMEEHKKERKKITAGMGLNWEEWSILLDYITNLQQQLHQASLDIQELTEKDIGCPSWCDKLTNLQQENERLKIQVSAREELYEYSQSRIEKADWWLREMLKQAKSDETKAIINGTLELLLNGKE